MPLAKLCEKIFAGKGGCVACHSTDGSTKVGPTYKGLFGKTEPLEDGTTAKVDENYLRESILQPNAKIVKGYPKGVMPSLQGQLSENEINALVEYIKELK